MPIVSGPSFRIKCLNHASKLNNTKNATVSVFKIYIFSNSLNCLFPDLYKKPILQLQKLKRALMQWDVGSEENPHPVFNQR